MNRQLNPSVFNQVRRLMGNRFSFTVVAEDEQWANDRIQQAINEVVRIEKLLTTFDEDSQTNQINRSAGITSVCVDEEVFDLIERSIKISELTQGAFDLTY
ncbi:MAG: FAD:protein FMN transferase, partial [Cytophagia bacterium]|nr:FAD:protein FMN transferase [Cytophagia bacterium]